MITYQIIWEFIGVLYILLLPLLLMLAIVKHTNHLDKSLNKTATIMFLINIILLLFVYLPKSFISETNTPDYDSLLIMGLILYVALKK